MTVLLDANVLIASSEADHVRHELVAQRVDGANPFATCPITQSALLRYLLRTGLAAGDAWAVLTGITALPGHRFWTDSLSCEQLSPSGLVGHAR